MSFLKLLRFLSNRALFMIFSDRVLFESSMIDSSDSFTKNRCSVVHDILKKTFSLTCFNKFHQNWQRKTYLHDRNKKYYIENMSSISQFTNNLYSWILCSYKLHILSLSEPKVTLFYLLTFIFIRFHSFYHLLSFVVIRYHSLYHSLSLVVICCHSLSFFVIRCTTRCHSM